MLTQITSSFLLIGVCVMIHFSFARSKKEIGIGNGGCMSDKDCTANAYCVGKRHCMCKNDYVHDLVTSTCLPKLRNINDSCSIDIQCTVEFGIHAYCNKYFGQCRCNENAHFEDGICYESVKLGGKCKVSDNCVSKSGVATYCAQSVCICTANYHPSADGNDCIPNSVLGQNCTKDDECVTDFSYCNKVCLCQSSHVISSDGFKCLVAAKSLRAQCLEDSQCKKFLPNTYCDPLEGICKCESSTYEHDQTCWKSVNLNEQCFNTNQCITPSLNRSEVDCIQGVCRCASGYSRSGNGCVKVKDAAASSASTEYSELVLLMTVIMRISMMCN